MKQTVGIKMKQTVLTIACVLGLFISVEALAQPAVMCPEEGGNAAPQAKAKTALNAPKAQSYYQSQLTKYPHPVSWTQASLDSVHSTTASNLALVYLDGDGKYKKYDGAAELFNKWGLDGQCGEGGADCTAVLAYFTFSKGFTHITDPVLKADKAITAYVEYEKYALSVAKYSCVNSTCYKIVDGVKTLAPEVTPSTLSSLYLKPLDWLALNKNLF